MHYLTNKDVQEALLGSRDKWRWIARGSGEDLAGDNSPLCKMFFKPKAAIPCQGCPVCVYTGKPYCQDTPYEEWTKNRSKGSLRTKRTYTRNDQVLAFKEVLFIENLHWYFFLRKY